MAILTEQELWVCAQACIDDHGAGAVMYAIRRFIALREQGDVGGAESWKRVIDRIDQLNNQLAAGSRPQ